MKNCNLFFGKSARFYANLALVLSIFITTMASLAQPIFNPVPQARPIHVIDGIELGKINALLQTDDQLVWLGSEQGLIRFDGTNAKLFDQDSQSEFSLKHDQITAMVQDQTGQLWLGTFGGGLNYFERHTERFYHFELGVRFEHVRDLALTNNQLLWLAGEQGIQLFDINTRQTTNAPFNISPLNDVSINKIFVDGHQQLWFLSDNAGIFHFDGSVLISYGLTDGLASLNVLDMIEDQQGRLWAATAAGLNRFDIKTQRFTTIAPSYQDSFDISDDTIEAMAIDHLDNLWLGSQSGGLYRYDLATEGFTTLTGDHDLYRQYQVDRINDIFRDAQGSIWIASDNGLVLVVKTALDISHLSNSKGQLTVTDIEPLSETTVAFTGNYQYFEYNRQNGHIQPRFANKNRIYRITKTYQGNLLFATLGQGLQRFSLQRQQLEQLPHAKPLHSDIPITGLFDSFIDSRAQVWLLPFPDLPHLAGGIVQWDASQQSYNTYLSSPFISDILQLSDDELLLSSDAAGLISFNIDTKEATRWQENLSDTPARVLDLFKAADGTLWFGTKNQGLAKFDRQAGRFVYYTVEHGLQSNHIFSIVEDQDHNLWLGQEHSLTRFNPEDLSVMTLQKDDGLLFTAFYKRAANRLEDGTLVLGANQGMVSLNPRDFAEPAAIPKVYINDFKLFNQSVNWRDSENKAQMTQPPRYTEALELSHQDDMLSFDFSVAEYIRPDAIQFAYQMEGLQDNWVYTDAQRSFASFTTLPDGEYTLRVKASNRHGQWGEEETRIKLTILPPWWLTWTAYVLYFIVAGMSLLLFINRRTRKLVERALLLEKSVNERTKELQRSRDQVSELLAQKQQLFASVSHEFRTPLTLILSPIEQLLKDPRGVALSKELGLIKRNGRRLLRMVDQLLEFAKLELKDDSQMERVSLQQTLDIIISSFEPLVKTKQIGLHVAPYKDATLNMLPDSLNKILINILSNAFKYSPPQSDIFVSVEQSENKVAIAIRDTGIGISEHDKEAVFQRFNRAAQPHGEAVPGAGIGLALVKELVEANFGTITLDSVINEGSTFTVELPLTQPGMFAQDADESTLNEVIHEHLDLEIDSVNTQEPSSQSNAIASDENQKSILIVDDNPDLRDLLYQQLSINYHCLLAPDGQKGLEIAREHLPDLIISDVMMPIMDGYELTSALKADELTSHIPVILLTAKGSMESRLKGLQLLVDDYLAKPFNMEELNLRINNILTIRDIIKQKFKQAVDHADPKPAMEQLHASDSEQAFVQRVNEHLSRFYNNPDFTAKLLSRELGVSERQLQRKLKAQLDLSFPELVRNYRLNKAVEMLGCGQRVSQIFHLVGFSSHSYFSSCFKAKFGMTPKEYQQN